MKREELYKSIMEKGINHKETIKASEKLDKEVFKEMIKNPVNENIYSAKWLKDAAEEALKRGVINYNYVLSILKNWKARGRDKHDRTTNNKQNTGQQLRDEGIGFTAEDLR